MSDKLFSINPEIYGARLAASDDEEQAYFFRGFARELASFPSHYEIELQMLHMANLLTKHERKVLAEAFEMLKPASASREEP